MHVHIARRNAHAPGLTLRYEVLTPQKKIWWIFIRALLSFPLSMTRLNSYYSTQKTNTFKRHGRKFKK